jgi:murein endopeptidase
MGISIRHCAKVNLTLDWSSKRKSVTRIRPFWGLETP